jgi:uncharacterized repeat protein (TIGR04076 family)
MSKTVSNFRITVVKKSLNDDLVNKYLDIQNQNIIFCDKFEVGQEFLITDLTKPPEGFCEWAWADIRSDILIIASGGNPPGLKKQGSIISGCTDWFRPVYFLIERVSE